MGNNFHNKPFDDETILKLEIFQGYIKEWLPVFLSRKNFNSINIFDFFAGPGQDLNGKQGTPLIIIDEINKYLSNPQSPWNKDIHIQLFFNDTDSNKISMLKEQIALKNTKKFNVLQITNQEFHQSLELYKNILDSSSDTKLLILDQCGIKQINSVMFRALIDFPHTDFMFFISSSFLKRFINTEEFRQHFPEMSPEEIKTAPSTDIHRFVCEYYKNLLPKEKEFYIAPFSIKKGANIYGIIFGSRILLGLEKFLNVCWNKDNISGDANYDIDDDMVREGMTLFPEMNIPNKKNSFKKKLIDFLQQKPQTNNELYKFTLENGCLPKHANDFLRELQKEDRLQTYPSDIRKGSFYIGWDYYHKQEVKAKFSIRK